MFGSGTAAVDRALWYILFNGEVEGVDFRVVDGHIVGHRKGS